MSCKNTVLSEMFKLDNDDWHKWYKLPKSFIAASTVTLRQHIFSNWVSLCSWTTASHGQTDGKMTKGDTNKSNIDQQIKETALLLKLREPVLEHTMLLVWNPCTH